MIGKLLKQATRIAVNHKKVLGVALSFAIGLTSVGIKAQSEPLTQLRNPTNKSMAKRATPPVSYSEDLLLVMPDAKADQDDINKIIEEAHGKVVATLGEGKLKVLVLKTEKGKLTETEKKLTKDKKLFASIGRNYRFPAHVVPNDPGFPASWHLTGLNCPKAWDKTTGGVKIAILDTGCQGSIADLSGKVEKGFDANTAGAKILGAFLAFGGAPGLSDILGAAAAAASSGARTDQHGHGTWVSSSAAARMDNSQVTAGVAPSSTIYPIRIADSGRGGKAMADDLSLICAMSKVFTSGARIVNLSYGAPYVGFHNAALHAPLHRFFSEFYYLRGGLIFLSAGNDAVPDMTPNMPYFNMVSAIDSSGTLANFSNWGTIVDFTAPGKGIVVSDIDGSQVSVDGTSFSSPIVAAEAALIWSRNPALPNFMVEQVLRSSCVNSTPGWNPFYGWGMPDASRAVKLALGWL